MCCSVRVRLAKMLGSGVTYVIARSAVYFRLAQLAGEGTSMFGRFSLFAFALATMPQSVLATPEHDLTGYWKNDNGHVLYFKQDESVLNSFHTKETADYVHYAEEIDFTASVLGNLVHGAHLIRLSWPLHRKCPLDMWVGMGLTLNADRTRLTGFRGHRTVDLINCEINTEATRSFSYTRMLDVNGDPLR